MEKKIKLLVIPDLFPSCSEDTKGIFILDYLKAVQPFCNISVFHLHISGKKKGYQQEQLEGIKIFRYYVSETPATTIWGKYFRYSKMMLKGFHYSKKIAKEVHLIHAHGPFPHGFFALLLAKTLNIPIVITQHSAMYKYLGSRLVKIFIRFTYSSSSLVMAVSKNLERQIAKAFPHSGTRIVTYNPIDTDLFQLVDRSTRAKNKTMILVSRLERFKGGLRSVQAFQKAAKKFPDWKFTIIGYGQEYDSIKRLLKQNQSLLNKVNLKGHLTKGKIALELKKASFFILPSEQETFGIAVAEALSCGLPVIISENMASTEFVDRNSGIVVPSTNINQIANGIEDMMTNLDRYCPEKIRKKIVDQFGIEAFGERMRKIYGSVLS